MPKQNPYKNPVILNNEENTIKEPKWIRPIQPITDKMVGGNRLASLYANKLTKVVDDVKNDYTESKFKIGNKTFVVMMVDDDNLSKETNLNQNDQFLFEVKKDQYTGELKFSVVQVTLDFFSDEADGCYFNGIAKVGNEYSKASNTNLFCIKRIDKDGKPVYNLAKYDTVHRKMAPSELVSTQPITFEKEQFICPLYNKEGQAYAGINTRGERTPAPSIITTPDGKDDK